ncbi:hypothetical protein [Cytobacillus horneckiae]|uniref:hypothetical protein n=1 Tax=Cytobacillus horneckiae TaxID=549687 RepID=UPI003D9A2C20
MNKKDVVDVLNNFEVIESNGGEEAYALVANTEENRKQLNEVGVYSDVIKGYGDEDTFCILALAFSEGYADLYDGNKLIAFEKSVEVEMNNGQSVVMYKNDDEYFLSVFHDGGSVDILNLSDEQIEEIKNVFC